ncbi:restriction endonuclease [Streptomyces atriruber]|uniref:Restriction endonuclease n=1 Tax=Streptomyces atriruber TaxID=545121 RepID=A0ABV3BW51_9ACTN
MTDLQVAKFMGLLDTAEDMTNTTAVRGRYYEDALDHAISRISGCQVQRNSLNEFKSEEVDISVSNYREMNGLRMLPEIFLVECKNWSKPVDSMAVAYFATKIRHRGCSLGVLVAAKGVTGDSAERTAALHQAGQSLAEGIKILLITTKDLRELQTISDLVNLLHRRFLDLHAAGTMTLS